MANERRSMRRQNASRRVLVKTVILLILLAVLGGAIWALADQMKDKDKKKDEPNKSVITEAPEPEEDKPESEEPEKESEAPAEVATGSKGELMALADMQATQYDYDAAMATLDSIEGAADDSAIQSKKSEYQATKDSCVPVNPSEVTHIFYHPLVVDPETCFYINDSLTAGFCQVMTTVDEFNKVTQEMYNRGFVLIHLRDLVEQTTDADGTVHFANKQVLLPPGKKAFVMSVDDVSYTHNYQGRGIADKLILDENGEVKNEYIEKDGSVSVGDYDVIPLLDQFVKDNPDASYRGAKATIALTGYNGVLGYRTDEVYKTRNPEDLRPDEQAWLDAHPNFSFEEDVAMATKIADTMKATGWEFASHTWGHINVTNASLENIQRDTERWLEYVAPIVGKTDTLIFAFGADIGDWQDYDPDNPKFQYFKSKGFNFFCNVDSSQYYVQIRDNYVRQGRRNIDGIRMFQDLQNPDKASRRTDDLFTVEDVFDKKRPTDPELYKIG